MSTAIFKDRLRGFGISFEKSLEDLIKGIRACQSDNEKLALFFDKSITECRQELKSNDLELKSMAILKLTYLEMYGFDMGWCSFNILEVMASSKFQHKRIGYLAAIQILQRQNNEDALMLMTNLLKKDLNSVQYWETSLAVSGIAAVVSKELAMDIADDMARMLTHSKPLIRKKAVLAMYKIVLAYPESLRQYYERIAEKLNDEDSSVVSAAVNVICELAHINPGNYVELIPTLFGLLEMTENNWMIIRLLKLFAHLSLTEPRLKGKLLPEIKKLVSGTMSLSICYECINSILDGDMLLPDDLETAELMVDRLIVFFESNDMNLRYVGLLALIKICKIRRDLIKKHDKILLTCIYDDDLTIRETALDIIDPLVTDTNIVTIVTRLIVQLVPYTEQKQRLNDINQNFKDSDEDHFGKRQRPIIVSDKYKFMIIEKIIEICSMNNYENIPNFKWYLGVLIDIIHLNEDNKIEQVDVLISQQFIDMSIRVPSIRSTLVKKCIELCASQQVTDEQLSLFRNGLKDCIWIIGEYYLDYINEDASDDEESGDEESDDDNENSNNKEKYSAIDIFDVIRGQKYLKGLSNSNLDPIIPSYIHSVAKLYNKYIVSISRDSNEWVKDQFESALKFANNIIDWLDEFGSSTNILTQERALGYSEILKLVIETLNSSLENIEDNTLPAPGFLVYGYRSLFESQEIKPINKQAQSRVTIPIDLDIDSDLSNGEEFWEVYNKLENEEDNSNYEDDEQIFETSDEEEGDNLLEKKGDDDASTEDLQLKERERKEKLKDDPYYIFDDVSATRNTGEVVTEVEEKVKKSKKISKPKKIKKEKVLVLADEELEDDDNNKNNDRGQRERGTLTALGSLNTATSKFGVDSSKLANIDLTKQGENSLGNDEYEIEQPEFQINEGIKTLNMEEPNVVEPVRRKPKKVKKKKAIIE